MLVFPDGSILGTVGGGELENRVVTEALASMKDGGPRFLEYQMADPEGVIRVSAVVRWRSMWSLLSQNRLL